MYSPISHRLYCTTQPYHAPRFGGKRQVRRQTRTVINISLIQSSKLPDWWKCSNKCRWSTITSLRLPAWVGPGSGSGLTGWNNTRPIDNSAKRQHWYDRVSTNQTLLMYRSCTGYDLKQLFIGAEGTLGIITAVSILTPPSPQASGNVILALPRFENVLPLYEIVKRQLSEILSAFEFIDRSSYELAVKHGQGRALSDEDVEGAECFVLIETSGGRREHDEEVRVLI